MRFNDLTGKRFGRLVVLRKDYYNEKQHQTSWWCKCDCSSEFS